MSYRCACSHLATVTDIPIPVILNSKERPICADCDFSGPNLWICLYRTCLKIGCSSNLKDHSTLHNTAQPRHCIHMNLSTQRIWCYECRSEVFMAPIPSVLYNDSEDGEDLLIESRDSGHGSYSTLQTNSPERSVRFDKNGGFNVCSMSGDTTESSDAEDIDIILNDRPIGLVGLQNIGNTCYMNAALQALSNTTPLTNFFLECSASVHLLSEDRKPGLSRQYQALMRDIWIKKNGGYVTPSGILYGIRNVHAMFRGYHQHDTQEFLRNFMDQLHEELKQVSPPECSINDVANVCMSVDEPALSSNYDSSEGEYETCDSGVSERSSLSDDNERPTNPKRRLSRSTSPNRRMRGRFNSASAVIESQPCPSSTNVHTKKSLKYRSIISDIFDGKLLSSVQCLTCDRVSSRVETFQDLSLPIPSRDHLVVLHGRSSNAGVTCSESVLPVHDVGWITWILAWLRSWFYGPMVTLHDCLAAFFSTDELKGDNMYSCERCNKLRNGLKYSKVLQLPEVLCIHLKRFRHELMYSSKISAAVSFPLRGLDMRPYLHKDCVSQITAYELFSVICHHGTAGGGHYTCYALNNGQWYEFDDQCVTRVSSEIVQNCEAYVLFYRKLINTAQIIKTKALEISELCDNQQEVAYLSKQWLSRFNTCAEPGPIDNSDFLCLHGSVNPKRSVAIEQLTTMVPKQVYDFLYKKFGGCPAITSIQFCSVCQALQRRIAREYEDLQQLNAEFENEEETPTHLLSSTWYSQWKAFVEKRILEPPGPVDNSKQNVIDGGNEEYIEINEDIWNFFYSIYGGGPELILKREVPVVEETIDSRRTEFEKIDAFYCKGEPMETAGESSGEVATEEVVAKVEESMPNSVNHSSNSNTSLTTDDDTVKECSTKKSVNGELKNRQHRRRRRRDLN